MAKASTQKLYYYPSDIITNTFLIGAEIMTRLLNIEIDGLPPSVNAMYRTSNSSVRYKRAEVSHWQDKVSKQMRQEWNDPYPYDGKVQVHIIFSVENNRRWDIDNRVKALLDCLMKGGVIEDDSQIWGLFVERVKGEQRSTQIVLEEYTGTSMIN